MIIKGRIPVYPSLQDEMGGISYTDAIVHDEMVTLFTRSNLLYNMSSSSEDIIASRYLSLYGIAKSIINGNFDGKSYVIESFNSQAYLDTTFPVDNMLNIDVNNGVLSLPIVSTQDLSVKAIILESDSNGQAGNSFQGFINADINAILTSNSSSLFEYEKIVNTFTATELYLSMTMILDETSICNGFYIKLYADQDTSYPVVDQVQTSNDGSKWIDVNYSIETINDYFIKFNPRRIRYIRVRLKQDSYSYITTQFGSKYRYQIGIRQIVLKQISYSSTGEYVSIPFASNGDINNVSMTWNDESLGDVRYLISANNGGKWLEMQKNNVLEIINQDAGLRGDINVESVRVKIEMNRTSSPNSATKTEYMLCTASNSYYLQNKPVSVVPLLGYHISRGDVQSYDIPLQTITAINPDALLPVPQCISDARYKAPMLYIPYYDGLEHDLVLKINGVELLSDDKKSIWSVTSHPNPAHSTLLLDVDKLPEGSGRTTTGDFSGTLKVTYKPYVHDHRVKDTSTIVLPSQSLLDTADGFTVQMVSFVPEIIEPENVSAPGQILVKGHGPENAIDNDTSTSWRVDDRNSDHLWLFEFYTEDYITLESYTITPFVFDDGIHKTLGYNPGVWELQVKPDGTDDWLTVDSQDIINSKESWISGVGKEFKPSLKCKYKRFRLRITDNCEVVAKADQKRLGFTNINIYSRANKSLHSGTEFVVIDRTSIKILPIAYDTRADYEVTYYPAVDITQFMTLPIASNQIDLQGLHQTPPNAKICFQYKYQDLGSIEEIKYYTPFCNEYRISFA